MARQEELRCQEEAWAHELADLRASQEAILANLETIDFEIEASKTTISRARETIAKTQAILKASQAKLD